MPVGHLGVVGMRARAGLIGGRLDLETAPGRGTRVRVAMPLDGVEWPPPAEEG